MSALGTNQYLIIKILLLKIIFLRTFLSPGDNCMPRTIKHRCLKYSLLPIGVMRVSQGIAITVVKVVNNSRSNSTGLCNEGIYRDTQMQGRFQGSPCLHLYVSSAVPMSVHQLHSQTGFLCCDKWL